MLKRVLSKRPVAGGFIGFGLTLVLAIAVPVLVTAVQADASPGKAGTFAPRATMTAEQRDAVYQAGPVWDGKGTGPASETDLENFQDYSLFWLGSTFGGYNPQWAGRTQYDAPADIPNARPWDAVTFIYGRCTPPSGASHCAAPITVHIQKVCAVRPEIVAEAVKQSPLETLPSGAQVQYLKDGHAMLRTGDVVIAISAIAVPELTENAIAALSPLGQSAVHGLTPTVAPDFSRCDPVDFNRDRILTSTP